MPRISSSFIYRNARVDSDFSAIADNDNPAIFRCELHVGSEIDVGEHFEDQFRASAARHTLYFIEIALLGVVYRKIGAFLDDQLQPFGAAATADDFQAGTLCQLNG
jgi:hypothetical protein